jgi:capsular polysaccharide biosynthesis protein
MGDQPLDLTRSLRALRRHWTVVCIVAALGVLVGVGYILLNPPMYGSSALVVLPTSTPNVTTQPVIAASDSVLTAALPGLHPAVSLATLRSRIQVTTPFSDVLSFDASGESAVQATAIANAVAASYVAYVSPANSAAGQQPAQILQKATSASRTPIPVRLLIAAVLGILLGLAIGAIIALAIERGDRRLRQRDEIADAIGVAVLASLPTSRLANTASWARLLEDYAPSAADAWRLRSALHRLGLSGMMSDDFAGGSSLAVVSLSSDHRALALGPQLAVFAASLGIPTALVIGPPQNAVTAPLRAACVTPSLRRSSRLRVAVADHDIPAHPDAALTVVVAVADARTPKFAGMIHTDAAVLGVSAGTVTAEQLARVTASAAADRRHFAGIFVADPDPADPTTGRLPQLTRQTQSPTRMTGTALVTRR